MLTLSGQNGGGQILRSSLTLSMITGQPFRLTKIRGGRSKPGLARQHLTCVKAAAEISNGSVDGAELGSTEIIFNPGKVTGGNYHFAIGTAGSTTLLAQTVLPALWEAGNASSLTLEGGTHNTMAPPLDFITRTFFPVLEKMGVQIETELRRYGFVPAGGGEVFFRLFGGQTLQPIELLERGELLEQRIHCICAHLQGPVAGKETSALLRELDWPENTVFIDHTTDADCQGNTLSAELVFEHISERVTSFGERGKTSQRVAQETAKMMQNYLGSEAVVGRHLSDQLLLPMALAGGGKMLTSAPSNHVKTNTEVIEKFLPVKFEIEAQQRGCHFISVKSR
ncbi:MAG: RNA 3'-terminal phosphate cyclase [Akkermansiaceae bacterium]